MKIPPPLTVRRMLLAILLRFPGAEWPIVAAMLGLREARCRRWQVKYRRAWDCLQDAVEDWKLAEAADRALIVLKQACRSANDRLRRSAAKTLLRYRIDPDSPLDDPTVPTEVEQFVLSPEAACLLFHLPPDPTVAARINELDQKRATGPLCAPEQAEYEAYIEAERCIVFLQAIARRQLAGPPFFGQANR
jgi:hypothetical protein